MSGSPPVHETQVRVRYGEVDRMGVVYHANYLVFFEQGRTEFLRSLGGTYRRLEEEGTLLVVVETGVKHHKPARYDDLLTVRTRLAMLKSVRMRFDYEVLLGNVLLASGFTVLAATDAGGRLRRLPDVFRARIQPILHAPNGKNGTPAAFQGAPPPLAD
jgi:acyl-CoA thioester hydrolase